MQQRATAATSITVIALGANASPDRAGNERRVLAAAARLRQALGRGLRVSPLWRSPAWPPGSGPPFVNAVAVLPRLLPPDRLLARLHRIEAGAGRVRAARWAARTLDLDLVASGPRIRPDRTTLWRWIALPPAAQGRRTPDSLLLPHPRMHERGFVLRPLAALAPRWRHPLLGRRVADLERALPPAARRGLRPLALRDGPPRRIRPAALVKGVRRA